MIVNPGSAEELANAIMTFYRDPEFCKRAGDAARQTIATRFTVEQTVEKTYQVYKDLCP